MPLDVALAAYAMVGAIVSAYHYREPGTHSVQHSELPGYSFAFLVKKHNGGGLVVYRNRHEHVMSELTQLLERRHA